MLAQSEGIYTKYFVSYTSLCLDICGKRKLNSKCAIYIKVSVDHIISHFRQDIVRNKKVSIMAVLSSRSVTNFVKF